MNQYDPGMLTFILFCLSIPSISVPAAPLPAPGFADIHNHMFSEYAFGGAWIHGSTEGEISKAMAPCDADDHAELKIPLLARFIGHTLGSQGDTGPHPDRREGYPSFNGWPKWDTIAHQQVWEGHLKSAHENGLNLLVVSLVNFEPFCELMPEKNQKDHDCSDTHMLEVQLNAAERFQKNHSWYRIVKTPSEARSEIAKGNLAVVLSLEASHLFGDGDWKAEFNRFHQRGVSTLQLAHQLNNRFAGAAIHHRIFRFISWVNDFKTNGHGWELIMPWKFGFQTEKDPSTGTEYNQRGLTDEGQALIRSMMDLGMPIDLAHLSESSIHEIEGITKKRSNYPVYVSHGHFREAMDDGKFSVYEKSSPQWILDFIRESGGVFGLRTGPEKTKAFPESLAPNDCQGSTKSFAQTYQFGRSRNLNIIFGTDFNGFIQQLRPRFGGPYETCGAESDTELLLKQQSAQKNPLHKRFDKTGFGDISQLPDVLAELKTAGVDTKNLEQSAEAYIRMWERAASLAEKK